MIFFPRDIKMLIRSLRKNGELVCETIDGNHRREAWMKAKSSNPSLNKKFYGPIYCNLPTKLAWGLAALCNEAGGSTLVETFEAKISNLRRV